MKNISVSFVPLDNSWDSQIKNYSFDIYHLSGWLTASSIIDKGKPKGIVADYNGKKMYLAFIARELDNGYWDATSSYGYGGPIIDDLLTFDDVNLMLGSIQSFLYDQGCVCLFKRLHPIINDGWSENITVGEVVTQGKTLVSDLTKSEEEHQQETSRRHRRGIKKARKNGVTAQIELLSDENIPVFSKIYLETMNNANAKDYYYFDNSYYYALKEHLQDRLKLFLAYYEDEAIAALLCTHCEENGVIQAHLGGTLNEFKELEPYKLLVQEARAWGRNHNYKILHFGGGVGAKEDMVYDFKKGFSSQEFQLHFETYRLITNQNKYNELVNKVELTSKQINSGYFPLYRCK